MPTADMLIVGRHAVVKKLLLKGDLKRRISELGLTPGTTVTLCRKESFGQPIILSFRGYRLGHGRDTAKRIILEYKATKKQ